MTPGEALRVHLTALAQDPAPGRHDVVPATEHVRLAQAVLEELARLDALLGHLRQGGSVSPPPIPPVTVPVHALRYHRVNAPGEQQHIWLEVSVDGAPWTRVPSPYGSMPDAPVLCPCPDLGERSLGDRGKWEPVTPLVEPSRG